MAVQNPGPSFQRRADHEKTYPCEPPALLTLVLSVVEGCASAIARLVLGAYVRSARCDQPVLLGDVIITGPKGVTAAIGVPLNPLNCRAASRPSTSRAMLSGQRAFQCGLVNNGLIIQSAIAFPLPAFCALATNRDRFQLDGAPFNFLFLLLAIGRGWGAHLCFVCACNQPIVIGGGTVVCRCLSQGCAICCCVLRILDAIGRRRNSYMHSVGLARWRGSGRASLAPGWNGDNLRLILRQFRLRLRSSGTRGRTFSFRTSSTFALRIAAAVRFAVFPLGSGAVPFRRLCGQHAIGVSDGSICLAVDLV